MADSHEMVLDNRMKLKKRRIAILQKDISRIENVLSKDDFGEMMLVHKVIDCKYHASLEEWGRGMSYYSSDNGFRYEYFDDTYALGKNLRLMRAKLELQLEVLKEGLREGFFCSYDQAKQEIDQMSGLSEKDSEEIIQKINLIERISLEPISKKKKWEKIKPILVFVMDKSVDVAEIIMMLILQM